MKIDRRSAVAVLCAVALCLAGLTVWDGIYHTRNTARTQLLEQLSDLSDYSSHYVRMYFDNLLQLSEDAALLIARNGDMLGADVLGSLDDVGERSGCAGDSGHAHERRIRKHSGHGRVDRGA